MTKKSYDFHTNNSESIIVGTDREEVLARIQRFEYQHDAYGRITQGNVGALDYNTLQAWKRLQKHILI